MSRRCALCRHRAAAPQNFDQPEGNTRDSPANWSIRSSETPPPTGRTSPGLPADNLPMRMRIRDFAPCREASGTSSHTHRPDESRSRVNCIPHDTYRLSLPIRNGTRENVPVPCYCVAVPPGFPIAFHRPVAQPITVVGLLAARRSPSCGSRRLWRRRCRCSRSKSRYRGPFPVRRSPGAASRPNGRRIPSPRGSWPRHPRPCRERPPPPPWVPAPPSPSIDRQVLAAGGVRVATAHLAAFALVPRVAAAASLQQNHRQVRRTPITIFPASPFQTNWFMLLKVMQ